MLNVYEQQHIQSISKNLVAQLKIELQISSINSYSPTHSRLRNSTKGKGDLKTTRRKNRRLRRNKEGNILSKQNEEEEVHGRSTFSSSSVRGYERFYFSSSLLFCTTRWNFPQRSLTQVELRACPTETKAVYGVRRCGGWVPTAHWFTINLSPQTATIRKSLNRCGSKILPHPPTIPQLYW